MKRFTAFFLVLIFVFSALTLVAFAQTNDGFYSGYYYAATLTSTRTTANTYMSYNGSSRISSNGTAYYKNPSTGAQNSLTLYAPPKTSSTGASVSVPTGNRFTSVVEYYYVLTAYVTAISVTVS